MIGLADVLAPESSGKRAQAWRRNDDAGTLANKPSAVKSRGIIDAGQVIHIG